MSQFLAGPVTITVPATSANLGPGFDCLGLALSLRDTLVGTEIESGLEVVVAGEGSRQIPSDERNLVVKSMRQAFAAMFVEPTGLRLECHNVIPQSRGLGSSSAAIVGGITLARAMVLGGNLLLDEDSCLALANRIEGHPDNVAPALLGGFVISGQADLDVWAQPSPVDPRISIVAFVPPHGVRTELARRMLPETVPHADAAANSGRAALLVAALGGAPERLFRGTEDFLHQTHRMRAMPDSLALMHRLRSDGVPAVISGAGPTVLAFVIDDESDVESVVSHAPNGWVVHHLLVDHAGAGT
jgi:homoserine kinase